MKGGSMDTKIGIFIIIGVCAIVLAIGILRRRVDIVLNFILRAVVGIVVISIINQILGTQNTLITVGVNPISVITTGVLGLPGVALLYGIVLTKII